MTTKFYEQQADGSLVPVELPEGVGRELAVYEALRARGLTFEEIKYLLDRGPFGTVR